MVVAVDVDVRVLVSRLDKLRSNQLPRAVGTALSRSGTTVRARVSRAIRDDLTLKASTINAAIKIERSNSVDGAGRAFIDLRARGGPVPLRDYKARMTRRGATFQVIKGRPRKLAEVQGRRGFIVGTRTDGRFSPSQRFGGHIMARTDASSRAFRKLYGPGIAIRVAGRRMRALAGDAFRERFKVEFARVLGEFIRRAETGRRA